MSKRQALYEEASEKLRVLAPEEMAKVIEFIEYLQFRRQRSTGPAAAPPRGSVDALRAWIGTIPGLSGGTEPQQWVDALRENR